MAQPSRIGYPGASVPWAARCGWPDGKEVPGGAGQAVPALRSGKLKADELQALLEQKAGELGLGKQELPGLKAGPEAIERGSAAAISAQTLFDKQGLGDQIGADPMEKLVKQGVDTARIAKQLADNVRTIKTLFEGAKGIVAGEL